jgi:leucyl aminopeptidase (aminopeptidase T)
LNQFGKDSRNFAEFGIGTNDKAIITGSPLEDEKVKGTAHLALGNNIFFGGKVSVPFHVDGIFLQPTIWANDKIIMNNGKFILK